MPFTNPYIQEVLENKHILTDTKDIYIRKGKWSDFFKNWNDICLEIGTWMGNFFSGQVEKYPHINFIWLELKRKRLASTYNKSAKNNTQNFVVCKELWQHIPHIFSEQEVSKTYILFPDPWGKKEYQKKNRLFTVPFMDNIHTITKVWGGLIIKTDDIEYFEEIVSIIEEKKWKIIFCSRDYEKEPHLFSKTTITEFESIWRGKRKCVCYLELERLWD